MGWYSSNTGDRTNMDLHSNRLLFWIHLWSDVKKAASEAVSAEKFVCALKSFFCFGEVCRWNKRHSPVSPAASGYRLLQDFCAFNLFFPSYFSFPSKDFEEPRGYLLVCDGRL